MLAGVVGVATFAAAPNLTAAWNQAPEDVRQIERSAYYPDCRAARSAGVAPIHAGSPGYREGLDRDSDGIACEPWRGR